MGYLRCCPTEQGVRLGGYLWRMRLIGEEVQLSYLIPSPSSSQRCLLGLRTGIERYVREGSLKKICDSPDSVGGGCRRWVYHKAGRRETGSD